MLKHIVITLSAVLLLSCTSEPSSIETNGDSTAAGVISPTPLPSAEEPPSPSLEPARSIQEVRPPPQSTSRNAKGCIRAFRDFFSYVQKSTPDIGDDKAAQTRFLGRYLLLAMQGKQEFEEAKAKEEPTDKREYPGNGDFIGAWDYPTTYSILGSRSYANQCIVDVEYAWGPGTNYEGTKRLMSFLFKIESGLWKLEDVYTFQGEFSSAESLKGRFEFRF
jgi:hypothetical protein